jgi:hypothetical protein
LTHQVWGVGGVSRVVVGQKLIDYGLKITGDIIFGLKYVSIRSRILAYTKNIWDDVDDD